MDDKEKQNTVFDRLNPMSFEHLRPLSKNSLMIRCEPKAGLQQTGTLPHPFINFKIEVVNNRKRKCDDFGYETPAKKVFSPNALSPDLGCVMDFSSPTAGQDSFSPLAKSKLSLLDSSPTVSSEVKGQVSSYPQLQQIKFGLPVDPANIKVALPQSLSSDDVPTDPAADFDSDVDDILCLSPAGASSARGFSENVKSCTLQSGNSPSVVHRPKQEKENWQVDKEQVELNKVIVKDKEEDKGYFSASYLKDHELGKNLSQFGYSQLPLVTSSPKVGEERAPEGESHLKSLTKQDGLKQVKLPVKEFSFTEKGFCPIVTGLQLESKTFPEELLEGDVEEAWNIGQPIFESSLCQKVSVNLGSDCLQVSEKLEGNVTEPTHECQTTLGSEESTYETSYDPTLPLVKVKSVVVALNQPGFNSYSSRRTVTPGSPRSFIKTKSELEREKRLYVQSVTAHMNERPQADPVTELRALMTQVADQIVGSCREQWQHPSDLTRRNYKKRLGNVRPNMTLTEWQAKNCTTRRRFSKIPKIFERSPL